MKLVEFNFDLPEELIAQSPLEKRTNSKMLVMDKETGKLKHEHFYDITKYFKKGDCLVLNETKVLPARLIGVKPTGANIEMLLLKEIEKDIWETLVKPAKRIKVGDIVLFGDLLKAECISVKGNGMRDFKLIYDGILIEILEQLGTMPLPPYIHERLENQDRYQTVYAKELGSAAAPTAGLHFTPEIIKEIEAIGVEIIKISLHVGLGTFRPVSAEIITDHKMHSETYHITKEASDKLNQAVKDNKKIIAVGTTTIRTLESNFNNNTFTEGIYDTNIFIYPGYKFKVVDELITNFHLPMSSLIMLVSAFSQKEYIMNAYKEAIKDKYRFFSFGDCMYIRSEK